MSIEDVGYLLEHSEVDSSTFFVDSSKRDQQVWPTPSEFSVSFEEPFKLVTGIDVLDASIPGTMYTIDNGCDTFVVGKVSCPSGTSTDIQEIFAEMQHIPLFRWHMTQMHNSDVIVCGSTAWQGLDAGSLQAASPMLTTTIPSDQSPLMRIAIVSTIVDSVPVYSNEYDQYTQVATYTTFTVGAQKYCFMTSLAGPEVVTAASEGRLYVRSDMTLVMYDFYYVDTYVQQELRDAILYDFEIMTTILTLEHSNYDINTLLVQLSTLLSSSNINVSTSTSGSVEMASKYKFYSANEFFFDMGRSNCKHVLGFDMIAADVDINSKYRRLNVDGLPRLFRSVYNADTDNHVLIGPGLVDVSGIRYLLLRCPEIEQHMPTSARSSDPGVGMFKLAGTNDITHLRFDFISITKKPIHPIGRLTRMTFKFETPDGRLYDFKGINLQMLMLVKFLSPGTSRSRTRFTKSILNPEYSPDYLQYMIRTLQRSMLEYNHDSDSDVDVESNSDSD
jgi:hypothetical protein